MSAVRVKITSFEYKEPTFGWYEVFADLTLLATIDVEDDATVNDVFFADYFLHAGLTAGDTWHYWVRAVSDFGSTLGPLTYLGDITISASSTAVAVKDEGVSLTADVASIDFVGTGVTATTVGDDVTVTIPGVTFASTTEQLTGTEAAKASTPDSVAALWEKGADIASAGTISIGEGGYFHITGTTTITDIDFATDKTGRGAWLVFDGALTLTHNATTLILPTGANILTAAGDSCWVASEGSDAVKVVIYQRKNGAALTASATGVKDVITFTLDGCGAAIPLGFSHAAFCPYACTITDYDVGGDGSGNFTAEVWTVARGSFPVSGGAAISSSPHVSLSGAQENHDGTLSGWTTAIAANTWVALKVTGTPTINGAVTSLTVSRT